MKAIIALFLVAVIVVAALAMWVLPEAQANLENAAAQRSLARAELRRADADVARANGEADALRMTASTPVVIVALVVTAPIALALLLTYAIVLLRADAQTQVQPRQPERIIYLVHEDGTIEQLPAGSNILLPARRQETEQAYLMDDR